MRAVALVLDGVDLRGDAAVPTQPHVAAEAVLGHVRVRGVVVLAPLELELQQLVPGEIWRRYRGDVGEI